MYNPVSAQNGFWKEKKLNQPGMKISIPYSELGILKTFPYFSFLPFNISLRCKIFADY